MAKIKHTFSGLENSTTYYGKVYSVNPKKRANNRADLEVFAAIPSNFPAEPTEYTLIDTYTTSQTWVAPEDGWFKVEVFGASGKGGTAAVYGTSVCDYGNGGGGGSGSYGCSIIKLKIGDTLELTRGAVGSDTSAIINSSVDESYASIVCTSGKNGGNGTANASTTSGGSAGLGGSASGGNITNLAGNKGEKGPSGTDVSYTVATSGGTGGAAVIDGANAGGTGGYKKSGSTTVTAPGAGAAGFIKISRGNTNVL